MTDLKNINLGLIKSQAKGKKTDLDRDDLEKFILDTLTYESINAEARQKLYDEGEIKEKNINDFDFYTEDGLTGIIVHLIKNNMLFVSYNDGDPLFILEMYKKNKKTKDFITDEDGEKILTNQVLLKIQSRKGPVSLFISRSKALEIIEVDGRVFVLTGRIQAKYFNLDTKKYVTEQKEDVNYGDYESYTLNVQQIGEVQMKANGDIKGIFLPEVNWKKEEESS